MNNKHLNSTNFASNATSEITNSDLLSNNINNINNNNNKFSSPSINLNLDISNYKKAIKINKNKSKNSIEIDNYCSIKTEDRIKNLNTKRNNNNIYTYNNNKTIKNNNNENNYDNLKVIKIKNSNSKSNILISGGSNNNNKRKTMVTKKLSLNNLSKQNTINVVKPKRSFYEKSSVIKPYHIIPHNFSNINNTENKKNI